MIATKDSFEPHSREQLPGSKRIYVHGKLHPGVRVPMREIAVTPTKSYTGAVTANDSVQMPPAIAGAFVTINNNGANTTKVYASPAPNAANASALDQICIHGTTALTANAAAVTVSSGYYTEFTCYVTGVWKQSAAPS